MSVIVQFQLPDYNEDHGAVGRMQWLTVMSTDLARGFLSNYSHLIYIVHAIWRWITIFQNCVHLVNYCRPYIATFSLYREIILWHYMIQGEHTYDWEKSMGWRQMGASLRRDQVEAHWLQRWPLAWAVKRVEARASWPVDTAHNCNPPIHVSLWIVFSVV